jgi:protein gp37
VTRLGPYEVHPFADAFPLIEGEEFAELVLDVKRNGLREPITLSADKSTLVDGRNRYRACEAAGLDPVFEALPGRYDEGMVLDLIVSKNAARRHLNPGQKAFVALKYEEMYAATTKSGYPEGRDRTRSDAEIVADRPSGEDRKAREKAAGVVGASGRLVQRAKAVQRDAPDLAEKVRSGEIALDAADRQRKERVRSQPKPDPSPTPSPVMLTLLTHKGEEVLYPQPKSKSTFNETTGEGISWASWSWNPVTGCLHGCDYCYAREIATSERAKTTYPVGFTPLFHHERLDAPANTSIPGAHRGDPSYKRVFVCSMADLYGRWVPDEWIGQVHSSMLASPWWQYILLTKFPSRYVGLDLPPKAWVGTSVDEQKRVRIAEDAFRQIDRVAVKWLSLEPLREPLEFTDLSMFDWVVIGSQTETRQPDGTMAAFAPPFEWVARIALQAMEAGCKVHLKPNLLGRTSPQLPGMRMLDEYPEVE